MILLPGMIVTIIAGGAGTRLWPLSSADAPKHLLSIAGDCSLLCTAYERALKLSDHPYVLTLEDQLPVIKDQIPELPNDAVIIEPARRNTSGCFLAMLHHFRNQADHNEPIAMIWADHVIRDVEGFAESFKVAGVASQKYGLPVFVGIEPTYPSIAFGYIHKAELLEGEQLVHKALGFKEKPPHDLAHQFFRSGEYLWNGGYMVGTYTALTAAMEKYCPALWQDYQKLLAAPDDESFKEAYLALASVQIDYTFSELVKELLVVPGTFDWMDVGSFNDLYDVSDANEDGNAIIGEKIAAYETANSYIRNDEDKPVAIIGLDNVVVVNTPNGILVARKDLSQKIREVSKQFGEK